MKHDCIIMSSLHLDWFQKHLNPPISHKMVIPLKLLFGQQMSAVLSDIIFLQMDPDPPLGLVLGVTMATA